MKHYSLLLVLLGGFLPSALLASEKIMSLEQVKPGMKGIAKTVFSGTQIEEFGVEVLDIIRNFYPQKDVILVRLIGKKVEETGVVSGMSGSPVYIEGKLVGALAYRFGIFQKEPIAGVTPIEDMLEVMNKEGVRHQEIAFKKGMNPLFLEAALGAESLDRISIGADFLNDDKGSLNLIRTPLVFSGFLGEVIQRFSGSFQDLGFVAFQGGGSTKKGQDISMLPGAALSAIIVDGDMGIEATGTLTWCKGDKILAFGHRLFNTGPVNIPMGRAKILTTLSSLMASNKLPLVTEVVGSIRQDRTTGLFGILGKEATMIPVKLSYQSPIQEEREFNFRVVEEKTLNSITPLFLRVALINALESARLAGGEYSLRLEGNISLRDYSNITLKNLYPGSQAFGSFSSGSDILEATSDVTAVIASLLVNNFQVPDIEEIELRFTSLPGRKRAEIQSIWYDKTIVKPGEEVSLIIFLKPYQGEEIKIFHKVKVPEKIASTQLTILVGSGKTITQLEQRICPRKFQPENFQQLVKLLNQRRRNDLLFIQVRVREEGALVKGEELPSLPPSILAVMDSKKTSGSYSSLKEKLLEEQQIPLEYALSGGKTIRLKILPKGK
jgi:hypothetical protein